MTNCKVQKPGGKEQLWKTILSFADGPIFEIFLKKCLIPMSLLELWQQIFMKVRKSERRWMMDTLLTNQVFLKF